MSKLFVPIWDENRDRVRIFFFIEMLKKRKLRFCQFSKNGFRPKTEPDAPMQSEPPSHPSMQTAERPMPAIR